MLTNEKNEFSWMLKTMFFVYRKELDREVIGLWWNILKKFDFQDIQESFNRHMKGEDGEIVPTPHHIFKRLSEMPIPYLEGDIKKFIDAFRIQGNDAGSHTKSGEEES